MERVLTIGVYGWSADTWLGALRQFGCDAVIDIRARRGVRGRQYAFANRTRLEAMLSAAGIHYVHRPELAPSHAIREAQQTTDAASGVKKRDRASLSSAFVSRYESEIADMVDWSELAVALEASVPALLCVERAAPACHRSIVAERLANAASAAVTHLVPA